MSNRNELNRNERASDGWTRRQIVQSAGIVVPALAAGLALPRGARAAQEGASGAPETLKIGLIGCGGRGTGAAEQALKADPDTLLWAAGDVFPDRLQQCLENLAVSEGMDEASKARVQVVAERRFTGFDAYQKVLDSGVDVVILTTPPGFRPAHFQAAVDKGVHVFLEKPVAVDGPGLRTIAAAADLAKQKGLAVVCGFCWRYNDGMRAAFQALSGGVIGDVVSVHTTYHTGTLSKRPRQPEWSDMEFQLRNWWHFTWLSGDHVVEQAVHSIDRLAWATGDAKPVRCVSLGGRSARNGAEHGNAFDHFAVVYEYDDGRRAYHTCRQIDGCPSDNADYVQGTKGRGVVEGWRPQYDFFDREEKRVWKYEGPPIRDMYQVEHDELFASIRAGKPIWDGERMLQSTQMAIMARMAAYTGQTIGYQQAFESTEALVPQKLEFGDAPAVLVSVPGQTKFA